MISTWHAWILLIQSSAGLSLSLFLMSIALNCFYSSEHFLENIHDRTKLQREATHTWTDVHLNVSYYTQPRNMIIEGHSHKRHSCMYWCALLLSTFVAYFLVDSKPSVCASFSHNFHVLDCSQIHNFTICSVSIDTSCSAGLVSSLFLMSYAVVCNYFHKHFFENSHGNKLPKEGQ